MHTSDQCVSAGGTVATADDGKLVCKISSNTCPSGWSRYENYVATTTCVASYSGTSLTCSAAGHAFNNSGTATAYIGVCYNVTMSAISKSCCRLDCTHNFDYCYSSAYSSCTTPITEIGCY